MLGLDQEQAGLLALRDYPRRVAGNPDAQEQPEAPDLLDDRELFLYLRQFRSEVLPALPDIFQEPLPGYLPEHHASERAGKGIAPEGGPVVAGLYPGYHRIAADNGTERYAAAKGLGKSHHIGLDPEMFVTPQPAGSAHAALHFVENKADMVLIGIVPQASEELLVDHVDASLGLQRFEDYGGEFVFVKEREGCLQVVPGGIVKPGYHWLESLVVVLLGGGRKRAVGPAVKTIGKGKHVILLIRKLPGPFPGELDGSLVGLGPAVAEKHLVPEAVLYQEPCEPDLRGRYVKVRDVQEVRSLLLQLFDYE